MKTVVITILPDARAYTSEILAPALLEAFRKAGHEAVTVWQADSLAVLETYLQETDDRHLVLYDSARCILAEAMENMTYTRQSAEKWVRQAEAILGLYRKNRRRLAFVSAQAFWDDPQKVWEALCQFFSLPEMAHAPALDKDTGECPIWALLLADHELQGSAATSQTITEIAAGSVTNIEPERDVMAAYEEVASLRRAAQLEIQQAKKQLRNIESSLKAERDLLRNQLAISRQELHEVIKSALDVQNQIQALETELRVRQERLDEFLSSTSWRITAPMRAIKLAFKRSPDERV